MSTQLGFGPIRDDEELLDRVGARSAATDEGLEGMLAAWTESIDADERRGAAEVGPLGLRRVPGLPEDASRVRVIRVRRTRAAAVLGAVALTVSGGGVAAAITQAEIAPVIREAIVNAVPGFRSEPSSTPTQLAASPSTSVIRSDYTRQIHEALRRGDKAGATVLIDVYRSLASKDPAGQQMTAEIDELAKQIQTTVPPILSADGPRKPTSANTSDVVSPSMSSVPTTGTTPTAAPSTATSTSGGDKGTATSPSTKSPSGSSTTPATTGPTTVGNAGGEQSAGTGSPTSPGASAPADSGTGHGAVTPETPKPTGTTAAPQAEGSVASPDKGSGAEAHAGVEESHEDSRD